MTTLDDLEIVVGHLRSSFSYMLMASELDGLAGNIADYIAAQRERDAAGVKVPPKIERHQTIHSVGYRHGWNDCRDDTISMNKPKRPLPAAPSGTKEPAP